MFRRGSISLIFGVLLTILVAWACVLWIPAQSEWPYIKQGDLVVFGSNNIRSEFGFGISGRHFHLYKGWDDQLQYFRRSYKSERFAGWPMHAFNSKVMPFHTQSSSLAVQGWDLPAAELVRRGYPTNNLPTWLHAQPERRLPLVPIWPGFAINTLFYGSLAWITLFAITRAKQRRRRNRGLCIACAYSVENLETCPECGTSIAKKAGA